MHSHLDRVAPYLNVTRRKRWEAIAAFDGVLDKDRCVDAVNYRWVSIARSKQVRAIRTISQIDYRETEMQSARVRPAPVGTRDRKPVAFSRQVQTFRILTRTPPPRELKRIRVVCVRVVPQYKNECEFTFILDIGLL